MCYGVNVYLVAFGFLPFLHVLNAALLFFCFIDGIWYYETVNWYSETDTVNLMQCVTIKFHRTLRYLYCGIWVQHSMYSRV